MSKKKKNTIWAIIIVLALVADHFTFHYVSGKDEIKVEVSDSATTVEVVDTAKKVVVDTTNKIIVPVKE